MYDEISDVRSRMMAEVRKIVDTWDGLRDEHAGGQNFATFLWTDNRFLARDPNEVRVSYLFYLC
jgi:hypothetical protein